MTYQDHDIRDRIILHALEDAAFEGWSWNVMEQAAVKAGYNEDMAFAVFPEKMEDAMAHFSELADREMIKNLDDINPDELRVRDRVKAGVEARLKFLEPHKEATRAASIYWLVPTRKIQAAKLVWQTADKIWDWAGDTAEDYNHYTKRMLLSGVITATSVRWLNDKSENHQETSEFLDRRIDNVLKLGKGAGKILGPLLGKIKSLNKDKVEI